MGNAVTGDNLSHVLLQMEAEVVAGGEEALAVVVVALAQLPAMAVAVMELLLLGMAVEATAMDVSLPAYHLGPLRSLMLLMYHLPAYCPDLSQSSCSANFFMAGPQCPAI